MTPAQKAAAQACVNVSETGSARGNYTNVTLIPGDAGHLTYGRSQTTLASGGLYELIRRYLDREDARDAEQLRPYMTRLGAKDFSLDHDATLKSALRVAGSDPVMQEVQDAFFDERYWEPAERAAEGLGLCRPLSIAVVYDSHVHGSWGLIRDRVKAARGLPEGDEEGWIAAYVVARRAWFERHSNPILHKSVRRMDAFQGLIDEGNWDLDLPFSFRGVTVDAESLSILPDPIGLPDFDTDPRA